MLIGTAAPTDSELARARHHLVRCRSAREPMNAFDYESAVMEILPGAFERGNGKAILTGGSMMYIDAVLKGIDEMPDIPEDLRQSLKDELADKGLTHMQERLRDLDPEYYATADLMNPRRVLHAIELCIVSGQPVSALRKGTTKERPFSVRKFAVTRPREELYMRIEARVDQMIAQGLEEEVRSLMPMRDLTALQTVGYREMFSYLNGEYPLDEAIRLIKRNTRHYAKKQFTWIKADGGYEPIDPTDTESALKKILQNI